MTEPQRAEDGEVLVNPSTGMPETRQERDRREQQNRDRQNKATNGDPTATTNES